MSDQNQMQETHQFEAQRAMWEFFEFLTNDDEWTIEKVELMLATYFPNRDQIKATREGIRAKMKGGMDLNSDDMRIYIRTAAMENVNEFLGQMDPFTRIAAAGVYAKDPAGTLEFDDMSPKFFISPLEGGGKFGYISGSRGKALGVGKTDFACSTIDMALESGSCIVTNIELPEMTHANFKRVITLKQMLRQCVSNLLHGMTTICILDEVPQFLPKERATSKEMVNMKQLLYLLRKMGCSLVVIAQRDADVPTAIIDMAIWHVQKRAKDRMIFRKFDARHFIKAVPGTRLKFITGESASFVVDLDVKDMHDYIVQAELEGESSGSKYNGKSQLDVIMEYLLSDTNSVTTRDLKCAAKVLTIKAHQSQREIAKLIGVSQPTIGNWLKEMNIMVLSES